MRTQKAEFDYCGQINMSCSCFGASAAHRKKGSGSGRFGRDQDGTDMNKLFHALWLCYIFYLHIWSLFVLIGWIIVVIVIDCLFCVLHREFAGEYQGFLLQRIKIGDG